MFRDCVVELHRSYRFEDAGGILELSRAVNRGDGPAVMRLLRDPIGKEVRWKALPAGDQLAFELRAAVTGSYREYLEARSVEEAYAAFERFRILCALRRGPHGVEAVNAAVVDILVDAELVEGGKRWYAGRPVLILKNDYRLQLFNGDVGITLPGSRKAGGELRVFFPGTDGTFRSIHPLRLPEHETVYAMTVHKSQGSEFDSVLVVLPDHDSPVLTRELLYTAVTRAKHQVELWGSGPIIQAAVSRRIERLSGLRDLLWEGPV
jgi:exodeoxyribonuclease V alpha subunit